MKSLYLFFLMFLALTISCPAQTFTITGKIFSAENREPLPHATVGLKNTRNYTVADEQGKYLLNNISPGTYLLIVSSFGYKETSREIVVDKDLNIDVALQEEIEQMDTVVIENKRKTFGVTRLGDVEGTAIYAGKKTEVVVLEDLTANTATNNSRQIYGRVAGLNIWENDGAGIQLGIGGRGLNPNRVSNFNTRQNGYDISADALGYPESYYSPPADAIERIEIVRGAASLQYGTQFGGLVNFKLKNGPENKKIELTSRQTLGSFGFFNSFNSVGGTIKKVNYYGFYQNKTGNGWRPNSEFNVHNAYSSVSYKASDKLSFTLQYTFMDYLAHQPGGLTDKEFEKDPRLSKRDRNWFKVNWNLGAVMMDYKFNDNLKFNTRFFGLLANRSALGVLSFINRGDHMQERDVWTDKFQNYGNESRLLFYYNIKKNPSTLLVGARYYRGFTEREQGLGNKGSEGKRADFKSINPNNRDYYYYTFPSQNVSLFAENIFPVTSKLSIIPGIRYENIITRANGFYYLVKEDMAGNVIDSQRVNDGRSNSRSFLLGGLGLSYHQSNTLQFYANISQNYRAINFSDMKVGDNPNLVVDPNLIDEKGYTADAGMRGNISEVFNYDFSLFLINYDNRIGPVNQSDPVTLNTFRLRTNISRSRNIGFESFAEADLFKLIRGDKAKSKLSIFSNFSIINAKYINSEVPAFRNKKVELAPNLILKSGLTFKRKKLSASYQFSYTGEQYSEATNATITRNAVDGLIPAYYIMDLSAQYEFNRIFTIAGSLNNLTNNMYFTRRADGYPGPGIIPSDGRSFFLTMQVKL